MAATFLSLAAGWYIGHKGVPSSADVRAGVKRFAAVQSPEPRLSLRHHPQSNKSGRSVAQFEASSISRAQKAVADRGAVLRRFNNLPLTFVPNRGQTDPQVEFLARGPGYTLFLAGQEAVLATRGHGAAQHPPSLGMEERALKEPARTRAAPRGGVTAAVRTRLLGARSRPSVTGVEELPGRSSYLRGGGARPAQSGLPTYAAVRYADVYPGVDQLYYGRQGRLEYDFVVAPGADPRRISFGVAETVSAHARLRTRPARLRLSGGDLVIRTSEGAVRFRRPLAYQARSVDPRQAGLAERSYVRARYVLSGRNRVGFELGPFDRSRPLVIDPVLNYSAELGGEGDDEGTGIAVDSAGNAYVTGFSSSPDFPVSSGSLQDSCGAGCGGGQSYDAFVSKLNSSGTALIYSTYLGGSASDYAEGIVADAAGDVYVTGLTYSSDFPVTPGAFQAECASCASGAADAFIAELNPAGSGLLYSTYLGGSGTDQANSIVLDGEGNAYVAGWTASPDFPTSASAPQTVYGGAPYDAFVAKLSPGGTALLFSTYLGGSRGEVAYSIALDSAEDAYVTGYTCSGNFPVTAGAFQSALGAPMAGFVAKLDASASAIVYSTLLGGSGSLSKPCAACASSIAVDASGNAYVAGLTWEPDFPTTQGAFQTVFAGPMHDAFLSKLNPEGSGLVYSTFLGGSADDGAVAIAIDGAGDVYLRGNTFSSDFPTTPDAFQPASGGNSDAFVAEVDPTGSTLLYSSYLGGSAMEYGGATQSLALDSQLNPNVYVTGFSDSSDFPTTPGALQPDVTGTNDAFVAKIALGADVSLSPASLAFGSQPVGSSSAPQTLTVTNTGASSVVISAIAVTGQNPGDFTQSNTCGGELAPGGQCSVTVAFTPAGAGGRAASVTLTDNAPDSPQNAPVSGNGTAPVASLSPASLGFGDQTVGTVSGAQSVTLTNTGTADLVIAGANVGPDFAQTNDCGSVLAAGAYCSFSVTFNPTLTGALNEALTITDNALDSPQGVALAGTGIAAVPGASLAPPALVFGGQMVGTTSGAESAALTNSGSAPLNIGSVVAAGDFGLAVTSSSCPYSGGVLAPAGTCTIDVTFTPAATGTRTGTVTIADDALGSPQMLGLTGTGTSGSASPVPLMNAPPQPGTAPPGTAELTVTINGAGFVPGSTLNWNGTPLMTNALSAGRLTATIPAADLAAAGTATLEVVNPRPGGGASNAGFFAVTSPTLSVSMSRSDAQTGSGPQWVGEADFNGDGNPDLAVVNAVDGTVTVLLGRGDGTFAALTPLAQAGGPMAGFVGDFNGDGIADLALACAVGDSVAVLLGNGDGTFTPAPMAAAGIGPVALAAGDFNSDGALDLAVANSADGTVSILLGRGDGTFSPALPLTAGTGPDAVATADLNGDGMPDLAVANGGDGTILIAIGNGDGTFTAQPALSVAPGLNSIAAADLNGDGVADLAAASGSGGSVWVLLGTGAGAFGVPTALGAGTAPVGVAIADLNGDGAPDLVAPDATGNLLWVLPGNGDGSFKAGLSFATGAAPAAAAAGDFNDDGRLDVAVAASGSGSASVLVQAPVASLAPSSLAFGNQQVGFSSAPQVVTLTNTGSAPLDVTAISAGPDYAQTNACTGPVQPGSSCTVSVTFTPSASGTLNETLTITDSAPDSPQTVSLTGTGTAPAVSLSPASLSFGDQLVGVASAAQGVTLTNTGTAALAINGVSVSGANGGDFAESNTCGATLPAGGNCSISVTFTPSATGARSASLTVADNAADTPQSVALSGTGTAPAVSLSPASLNFGNQPVGASSAPLLLTLTNSGTAALTVGSIAAGGVNGGDFAETNTCGATVSPGNSCTISVVFTPSAAGTRTAAVDISDNAGGSPQSVGLTGNGTAPTLSLSPQSLTFPTTLIHATSPGQKATITNTSAGPLIIYSIKLSGQNTSDFNQASTCPISPATLGAGQSCSVMFTFRPTAQGLRSGSALVTDNASDSPQKAALAGACTVVQLSPAGLNFGTVKTHQTSGAKSITVSNLGSTALSISVITVTGTNSSDFRQSNSCGNSLGAGGTCKVNVTFKPSAKGSRTASLSIVDSGGASPQTVPLSGMGN